MPMVTTYGQLKCGNYAVDANLLGIDREKAALFGFTLSEGELPRGKHGNTYEIVLGAWTLQQFYNPNNYRQALDKDGNPKVKLSSRMQLTFDYSNINPSAAGTDNKGEAKPKGAFYPVKATGVMDMNNNDFAYYCLMELGQLEKLAEDNKAFTNFEPG